jgi:hypothetical protein
MESKSMRSLYWAPRLLCILFAAFLSLFALDVFGEGKGFGETTLALLIHLVPTYILVIALIIAWRWELIGGILFICFGLVYIVWTWGRFPIVAYGAIAGPLFLVGILFLLNWKKRRQMGTP